MSDLAPGFPFSCRLRVRYADTDAMGIVYHANYLIYFEVARVEYLRAAGVDYRSLEDRKMTGALVESYQRYHAPSRFDDELTVFARCSSMGKVRFRMDYEIWRADDRVLVVTGYTDHALLAHQTLRPIRIPEWVREGVERFEARADAERPGGRASAGQPVLRAARRPTARAAGQSETHAAGEAGGAPA
ncbi:MAG: acyl-CoA thioesterase [Chloroflexi bacterium]|nr:acyl-CoA thioesterase [Chloroflexota bacterium]